ncbi:MAG: GGDEF domain-containing protein [Deltaproteobacteria bacterium]|nr:GGDEF domain-containing protein [Deltaproteobacteria bacterium]
MQQIREAVLTCLNQVKGDEKLIRELNSIAEQAGGEAYQVILHVLTHLDLDLETAKTSWKDILILYNEMSKALGRTISLRTAICDYFCSVQKSLKNPKVVEIHVFEKTLKNSRYDSLTNMLNRQALDDVLNNELNRAKRHQLELSIIFFDLDNFKCVNDIHGHQAGDEALRHVAATILHEKRQEDSAGRYGGEELVLVLPETNKKNAGIIGERVRAGVEKMAFGWEGKEINVTLSGGIASFKEASGDVLGLVGMADKAVQLAKDQGKNRIL